MYVVSVTVQQERNTPAWLPRGLLFTRKTLKLGKATGLHLLSSYIFFPGSLSTVYTLMPCKFLS